MKLIDMSDMSRRVPWHSLAMNDCMSHFERESCLKPLFCRQGTRSTSKTLQGVCCDTKNTFFRSHLDPFEITLNKSSLCCWQNRPCSVSGSAKSGWHGWLSRLTQREAMIKRPGKKNSHDPSNNLNKERLPEFTVCLIFLFAACSDLSLKLCLWNLQQRGEQCPCSPLHKSKCRQYRARRGANWIGVADGCAVSVLVCCG